MLRTEGLLLVGPYANGKTMIAERFVLQHLGSSAQRKAWIVQTHEGTGLAHFYASVIAGLGAPTSGLRSVARLAEQVDALFRQLRPRMLIFDEFHNALRGRSRDVEAIFAFLRRLGREYDVSPVLIGEVAVYDHVNATAEMASRFSDRARFRAGATASLISPCSTRWRRLCRSGVLPICPRSRSPAESSQCPRA